jgi:hypothetical protein
VKTARIRRLEIGELVIGGQPFRVQPPCDL